MVHRLEKKEGSLVPSCVGLCTIFVAKLNTILPPWTCSPIGDVNTALSAAVAVRPRWRH